MHRTNSVPARGCPNRGPTYPRVPGTWGRGGRHDAIRFVRGLRLARVAPSLGGTETLVTLPALTASSHMQPEERRTLGIDDSLIRISVGLE
ncbi:MAG: PLP-dependent transferase, partial [Acidilobus sp.]